MAHRQASGQRRMSSGGNYTYNSMGILHVSYTLQVPATNPEDISLTLINVRMD